MLKKETLKTGLTFDDVLILPARSEVLPEDVKTETKLTRNINLHAPLVSAAMDTVTEGRMAIALSQLGGMGIIHKNFSIEEQKKEVDKVKRSESGMIIDPITIGPEESVETALDIMEKYHISGIPVVENDNKLVGIITNRDLRFETRMDIKVSKLMTTEDLITVPMGTGLDEAKEILHEHRIEKLLVVDDDFKLRGLITVKDIKKKIQYPNATKDSLGRLMVGAAVGTGEEAIERTRALVDAEVDVIVIDSAHAHSRGVMDTAEKIRKEFSDIDLIVGNVARADATREMLKIGVDAIKVGIGPGSICTTRVVAGVGVPQLTAIAECAEECRKKDIPLIADGGIKYSGDITKAIAAGADTVMIGSLFAGTDESPGERVSYQGRTFKTYRGMGSIGAMEKGSGERYFQDSDSDPQSFIPEGVEGRVPYKGNVSGIVFQLIGGLKQGMGYAGCESISAMKENAEFIRVTSSGLKEGHPHDVTITKEAPNYKLD